MRIRTLLPVLVLTMTAAAMAAEIPNPAIDMEGYLRVAQQAATVRSARRVSEADFIRIAGERGAVILDARSAEKFRELHVRGAVNLSFPDFTADNLKNVIGDFNAPVLIYCNNNFLGAEKPFPGKIRTASLNLSTYIALYSYGYRNVYELGPLVDIRQSKLPFEGLRPSADVAN